MLNNKLISAFFCAAILWQVSLNAQRLTDYVDPFIGTGGHGHTYPGASMPFGMVQLSPDTDTKGWDWCSGYHYSDTSIIGFSHTHLSGTGCADYGDILFMPTTGELKTEPGSKDDPDKGYRSGFSHDNEKAAPGYYSVLLDRYNIAAELTVTKHAGFQKYVFPKSGDAHIIIDLVHGIDDKVTDSELRILNDHTVQGYRRSTGWAKDHCVYFYAQFSKPFISYGIAEDGIIKKLKGNAKGKNIKAFLDYNTSESEAVLIRIGISHASIEGAKNNLLSEISDWDFNKVKQQAASEWEKQLSSITIQDKDLSNKRIFYTALYHSLLNPNIQSDADYKYIGMDKIIHTTETEMYTVFSLWDTFRAANPLLTILDPQRTNGIVESLLKKYRESGLLPGWELASNETGTMIGYHSIPVIADAILKGINNFNIFEAFDAMKKSAMQDVNGLKYYREMGYIPSDLEGESVSKTLEYAYDDWCIAKTAEYLWKSGLLPAAEKDYNYYLDRAKQYQNVFDPATSLMRAKKNGMWYEPFDPYSVSGNYTEANAWQYSFFVPQDVSGLIKLMGGNNKFLAMLDKLFTTDKNVTGREQPDISGMIGQYAHGNEPSHHMAYLFSYAGAPWKTAEKVHQICTKLYTDKIDGLAGNEDCGQMSAWYVFSSIGFYPVCPGDDTYIIGSPLFDEVKIKSGNNIFIIRAKNRSDKNIYIQSAILNGKMYNVSFLKHSDILKGGELVLAMGPAPSVWGTDKNSRPVSEINLEYTPVPFVSSGIRIFTDSVTVSLSSIDSSYQVFYSTDSTFPAIPYNSKLIFHESVNLNAVCLNNGKYSKQIKASFTKLMEGRTIKLLSDYSSSYPGGGPQGLIDNIHGTDNYHTDAWQGYEGNDFNALIDLGKEENISSVTASFLQNVDSWIFYPSSIQYSISTDGENYTKIYEQSNVIDQGNTPAGIKLFEAKVDQPVRYIKVYARNLGFCPPWHKGAGGKAWLFIDEISIN